MCEDVCGFVFEFVSVRVSVFECVFLYLCDCVCGCYFV